ncbi:MAG: family 16 glycosylhydrolase, partial [Candidatus Margulisiibacteriota bacterium]
MLGSVSIIAPIILSVVGAPEQSGNRKQGSEDTLITGTPTLKQEMDSPDRKNWQKANWSNGKPFNCTWQPDNVTFRNGIMRLTLDDEGCRSSCDGWPFASGEYRTTQQTYKYGYYEARMKPAAGKGLVSSFFVYAGTYGKRDHHEIDLEFLGKNCKAVQTNYYAEGKGSHQRMISLGFNACKE